jgi:hypothetical protein
MKEVEKKDVPEVSGGQTVPVNGWLPIMPTPFPGYPPTPAGPTDGPEPDPLGDRVRTNQIQS